MSYRSINRADARQLRAHLIDSEPIALDEFGELVGEDDLLDLVAVRSLASAAVTRCVAGDDPEAVEHAFSGEMYLALKDVPVVARDDVGFWRWVTFEALLPFVRLREPSLGLEVVGAGTNSSDILACRMFLRGQVARVARADGSLDFSLACTPGTKTHDLWQSHIVRRTTAGEREFARALIAQQADLERRLKTSELRTYVRDSINRKKRTIATFLMNEEEARGYLQHERETRQADDTDPDDLDDDLDE